MTSIRADGSVEFRFFRPAALDVSVAGDFRELPGTTLSSVRMSRQADGWWTASVRLTAGEYRFRYLADGQWFADYAAYGIEAAKQGWTSVLLVPPSSDAPANDETHMDHKRLAA